MEEGKDQMQTQVDQSPSSSAGMLVVAVLLLAIAGVIATVLWMLRA